MKLLAVILLLIPLPAHSNIQKYHSLAYTTYLAMSRGSSYHSKIKFDLRWAGFNALGYGLAELRDIPGSSFHVLGPFGFSFPISTSRIYNLTFNTNYFHLFGIDGSNSKAGEFCFKVECPLVTVSGGYRIGNHILIASASTISDDMGIQIQSSHWRNPFDGFFIEASFGVGLFDGFRMHVHDGHLPVWEWISEVKPPSFKKFYFYASTIFQQFRPKVLTNRSVSKADYVWFAGGGCEYGEGYKINGFLESHSGALGSRLAAGILYWPFQSDDNGEENYGLYRPGASYETPSFKWLGTKTSLSLYFLNNSKISDYKENNSSRGHTHTGICIGQDLIIGAYRSRHLKFNIFRIGAEFGSHATLNMGVDAGFSF